MPFWVKTVLLGQEVHYYMVYIAYFTELNSKIWDYAQKRRICRENCKYALDERFHGHFCPRRKPAKSCHPAKSQSLHKQIIQTKFYFLKNAKMKGIIKFYWIKLAFGREILLEIYLQPLFSCELVHIQSFSGLFWPQDMLFQSVASCTKWDPQK